MRPHNESQKVAQGNRSAPTRRFIQGSTREHKCNVTTNHRRQHKATQVHPHDDSFKVEQGNTSATSQIRITQGSTGEHKCNVTTNHPRLNRETQMHPHDDSFKEAQGNTSAGSQPITQSQTYTLVANHTKPTYALVLTAIPTWNARDIRVT
jgi:hypothetical protein